MTGLTQRYKVALIMCAALRQRLLVVYLFHRYKDSSPLALLTERVSAGVAVTDTFPRSAISTAYSRVTVVLLVAAVLLLLMLLTKSSLC